MMTLDHPDRPALPTCLPFRTFGVDLSRARFGMIDRHNMGIDARLARLDWSELYRTHHCCVFSVMDRGMSDADLRVQLVKMQRLMLEMTKRYAGAIGAEAVVVNNDDGTVTGLGDFPRAAVSSNLNRKDRAAYLKVTLQTAAMTPTPTPQPAQRPR